MDITNFFAEFERLSEKNGTSCTLRRAILWSDEDLLLEKAIESLLNQTQNWQVIKIPEKEEIHLLTQAVAKVDPEIIIINQGRLADPFPSPLHLIDIFPELKIITVNMQNNLVEIYSKQKIWIKEAADLISIIDEYPDAVEGGERQATESQPFNDSPATRTGNVNQKEIKNDRS